MTEVHTEGTVHMVHDLAGHQQRELEGMNTKVKVPQPKIFLARAALMDGFLLVRGAGGPPAAPGLASAPVWLEGQAQLQVRAVPRPSEDPGAGRCWLRAPLRPRRVAVPDTAAFRIPLSGH